MKGSPPKDSAHWSHIMAKKKSEQSAEDTSPAAPKDEPSQKTPEMKTVDMVKAAIAAGKGMPKEGVAWIKEQYGADVKIGNFSVHKSNIDRANGKASARG